MAGTSLLIIGSRAYKKSTVSSLIEEAKKLFDRVMFVSAAKIRIVSEGKKSRILFKDRVLDDFDACYPRLSSKDFFFGQNILRVLEESGCYTPVNLKAFQVTNHKYYTIMALANAGIPIVKSSLFISTETVSESIKEFGLPVVVKTLSGFAGKGVVLVEDQKQFESILDAVQQFEEVISAQKFIAGKSSDIRCYVFGEKVIAIRRTGRQGEWRANVSRGGKAEEIPATNEMKKIAQRAAGVLGMEICSVDVIETGQGLAVVEVNFMPGPFKQYLGNKITREMVEFLHKKALEKKFAA